MRPRETPLVGFWDRPQGLGVLRATAAGLTSDEAKRRLRLHGPNSLVQERRFAALLSFIRFFANPFVIILVVASTVSLSLEDRVGGLIIIAMVLLSVLLNFFMEFQARHAVEEMSFAHRTRQPPHGSPLGQEGRHEPVTDEARTARDEDPSGAQVVSNPLNASGAESCPPSARVGLNSGSFSVAM